MAEMVRLQWTFVHKGVYEKTPVFAGVFRFLRGFLE
jgi:hypothetical protein